jgi:uroporphyrin-3 C-methyltransferase
VIESEAPPTANATAADAGPRSALPSWAIPVALVVFLVSMTAFVMAWQSWSRQQSLEQELVRRQEAAQVSVGQARVAATQALDQSRDTAAKVALLDAKLAEVALQRTQLEELMQSMSRSRDENMVGDIEAAIQVAMQQTSITGSAEPLVATLRQADERLQRYKQPRLEGIRRAVARDLDRVKAVSVVDVSTLTIKLDEVARLLDELPLQSDAASDTHVRRAESKTAAATTTSVKPATKRPEPDADAGRWAHGWWQVQTTWDEFAQTVWGETRNLVRVTRIDHPEAALITPEQGFFLRENLKLRLLNARLALLSRQFDTAQFDLRESRDMLGRYFDMRSRKVMAASELLGQVSGQARQVVVPRPDDTLAALTAAAAGR